MATKSVNIGVDLGSTGLRAAYIGEAGQIVVLTDAIAGRGLWLLCEPSPTNALGMEFPSLKSKLGTAMDIAGDGGQGKPSSLVTDAFRALKKTVETQASKPAGQVVISVPARYYASQRAALREAALQAGFDEAHLISDSIAAVIAYTARSRNGTTILVYSMGYAGFEVGLVQAARGHYRALGYEGGPVPSGQALDEFLLRTLFHLLAENNLFLDTARWNAAMWMQIRAAAQKVKEGLSVKAQVPFPLSMRTPDGRELVARMERTGFEEVIGQSIQATLGLAQGLLEQANLTPADVDIVLLSGESTRIPILQVLVEQALRRKPVLAEMEDLARGAALHAARLKAISLPTGLEPEKREEIAEGLGIPAATPALRASIVVSEATSTPLPSGHQLVLAAIASRPPTPTSNSETLLQHARELIEQGRAEQARAFLQMLIDDAQALLASIPARAPARKSTIRPRSRRAIARARQMITEGQYEEAIRQSHLAWQDSPDSPDVFEQMIDIHCQAAMSNTALEGYTDALSWLMCAYRHDESNVRVRRLLAERHYIHAKQLADYGRRQEAFQAAEQCLSWNPEHQRGKELQQALIRR
jgi:ElaB/YqjD/DUF883 family membrane-anchored ribosome-binding protein